MKIGSIPGCGLKECKKEVYMKELKITKSAYIFLEKESRKYAHDDMYQYETGGILIGTLEKPIVIRASKAGVNAILDNGSYTNDAEYDYAILRRAIKQLNGRVKLVGYWHKHPGCMSHPSSLDLATAKSIVSRNERSDKRPVYFVITNVHNSEFKLYGYSLEPNQENLDKVVINTIEDNSHEVENALSIEPIVIQPRKMDFWNNLGFRFYLTKVGYKRLREEVHELYMHGYNVSVYTKGRLQLVKEKNLITLCTLPPEYPLNPPRFFKDGTEIKYSMPIWNSSFRIIDLLRILEKQQGGQNESPYFGPKHRLLEFAKQIGGAIKSLRFRKKT
jgi:proteasome lid subunit RPN8/RPN11